MTSIVMPVIWFDDGKGMTESTQDGIGLKNHERQKAGMSRES
jgi:hypothetical protein